MATNSVIEHRANYYFVKLREEYLALCNGNHCQALILSVLEEWTNTKKREKQSLYIYMTYPQWVTALYGAYGRNAIIKALAELEDKKIVTKRPYRLYGKDTFEYLLNVRIVNSLLKELPEKGSEETLPNINAFKKGRVPNPTGLEQDGSSPSPVQKRTGGTPTDAFKKGRNIESITQNRNSIESEVAASMVEQSVTEKPAADATDILSLLKNLSEEERKQVFAHFQQPDVLENPPKIATKAIGDKNVSSDNSVCFVHPDYGFLAFDNSEHPTQMTIYLTSKRWESELEDDRRMRVAQELRYELENRGVKLEVHVTRELDKVTIEAEVHSQLEEPKVPVVDLQKPASDALMTEETVVTLVEFLRGERYAGEVRRRELRAAKKLLNFQPAYSLAEIETAWYHGSDDYWREKHGGQNVHVHDLVNTDSHGRHRIGAFLEHKQAQERRTVVQTRQRQRQVHSSPPPAPPVSDQQKLTLTETEAHTLVEEIAQVAQERGYTHLHGSVQQDGEGWTVRVSWQSSAWKGDLDLEIRSRGQWLHECMEWSEIIQLRAQRKGA